MKLALGLMVKNEEARILVTLKSAQPWVDCFVILDTGSTDRTCELVEQFCYDNKIPFSLYRTEFIDFSTSRNELLDHLLVEQGVTHSLLLDCNDEVQHGEVLRPFLEENSSRDGFLVTQIWKDDEKRNRLETIRLIKNAPEWRYKGVVHEVLHWVGRKQGDSGVEEKKWTVRLTQFAEERPRMGKIPTPFVLFQDRNADQNKSFARYARDIELLTKEYQRDPTDPRTVYYLANSYYFSHRYDEAIEWYQKRITDFPPVDEEYHRSLIRIGMCRSFLRQPWEQVFPWFWRAWEMLKDVEPIVFMARTYYDQGDHYTAYHLTKMACGVQPPNVVLSLEESIYDYKRWWLAAFLYFHYGEYEEGYQACRRALTSGYAPITEVNQLLHNQLLYEQKIRANYFQAQPGRETVVIFGGWGYNKWNGRSLNAPGGVGGSETACIHIAQGLVEKGYHVVVASDCEENETIEGVEYIKLTDYESYLRTYWIHTLIVLRFARYLRYGFNIGQTFLWLEDVSFQGDGFYDDPKLRAIVTMCRWHQEDFQKRVPEVAEKVVVIGNAILPERFTTVGEERDSHRFIYSSCPSRGLEKLVEWFPEIRKIWPDATLEIFSDFKNEYVRAKINVNRLLAQISQTPGVTNHGRIPQSQLALEILRSGIWLYPTEFEETYCITAVEMQAGGVLCLYTEKGSLPEVVGERGIRISLEKDQVLGRLRSLTSEEIEIYRNRGRKWAFEQTWDNRVEEWVQLLEREEVHPGTVSGYLFTHLTEAEKKKTEKEEGKEQVKCYPITLLKSDQRVTFDILREGSWEIEVMEILLREGKKEDLFLDVGANVGPYAITMGGAGIRTFAFEPDARFFSLLETNLRQNKLETRVTPLRVALGEKETHVLLSNQEEQHQQLLSDRFITQTGVTDGIPCVSLDHWMKENLPQENGRILMKIDVQGFELKVLQGAKRLLKERDVVLFIEIEDYCCRRYHYSSLEIQRFLKKLGYTLILIEARYRSHYLGVKNLEEWRNRYSEIREMPREIKLVATELEGKIGWWWKRFDTEKKDA